MSRSSAHPKGWGEESWQGSNRAPTENQCPAALSRPRGKRCCWDAPGAPTPALLPVASIPGRGVLLPPWDEDGKTGWGLTFPQRTRLWRMRQVGMGSRSFQEEVKACTSPGIWWHFVTYVSLEVQRSVTICVLTWKSFFADLQHKTRVCRRRGSKDTRQRPGTTLPCPTVPPVWPHSATQCYIH